MVEYSYNIEKEYIFSSNGVELLLKIRDTVDRLLDDAGAFKVDSVTKCHTGDTFMILACLDYLEEIGETKMAVVGPPVDNRVYVRGSK